MPAVMRDNHQTLTGSMDRSLGLIARLASAPHNARSEPELLQPSVAVAVQWWLCSCQLRNR